MASQLAKDLKPILAQDDALLDSEKTAALIVSTRNKIGVQQKSLALEMGISVGYLCDLESANRRWSLELFNKAKTALIALEK